MPHSSGRGKACRWVSAERLASAITLRTASSAHRRVVWVSRSIHAGSPPGSGTCGEGELMAATIAGPRREELGAAACAVSVQAAAGHHRVHPAVGGRFLVAVLPLEGACQSDVCPVVDGVEIDETAEGAFGLVELCRSEVGTSEQLHQGTVLGLLVCNGFEDAGRVDGVAEFHEQSGAVEGFVGAVSHGAPLDDTEPSGG